MAKRRIVFVVSTLAVALVVAVAPAASAVQVSADQVQEAPFSTWNQPGTAPLDGMGAWIYVAPKAVPGTQDPYDYLLRLDLSGPGSPGSVYIGLATRPGGPVAGMSIISSVVQPPILTPFNWAPGNFYYLLVYSSGPNQWIGWVYDYTASSWTIVGQMTAPAGSGLLGPSSRTMVDHLTGPSCADFPRSDVFFYPPVGYRGSTVSLATLGSHDVLAGGCPSTTTIEYDWVHYQVGAEPAAA